MEPAKGQVQETSLLRFLASLVVVMVTIGVGFTWIFPPNSSDQVSTEERQSRQESFNRLEPLQMEPIDPAERTAATEEMQLPPFDQIGLRAALADGDRPASKSLTGAATDQNQPNAGPQMAASQPLALTRVTLWDTHAQDGDVVAIVSAGYRREVQITNAKQQVIIPVRQGVSTVEVIGIHDGGGGITLGVQAAGGRTLLPIMGVGQTLALPVRL